MGNEKMYCEKCGHEMKNGRCPNCGFPVGEPQWEEQKSKKKSGKKIGIIILSVVIVLIFAAAILAAIFWLKKENTQKKFDTHIEKGQKYLEEMDYEKAADNYLAAIDIDPKAEDPYMKLADLYLEIDQPENAAIVLKKGVKNTGSRAMKNRYDLYTYVDQNLIPEEGQCEEGEYECDYYEGTGYWASVSLESNHSQKGVMNWKIMDFDGDGEEELLVIYLNNKEEHYLNQVGRSKSRAPYHFGNLEGSYEIDSLNLLTVGIGLYLGTTRSVLEYAVKMLDADRNPVYSYNRNSESSRKSGSADMNVDYQRSTRKKDELLTLSYRFSRSPNDNEDYTELTDIRNYEPWLGYPQNNINKASTNEHTGQFDYTTPTWKDQSLEAGIKYIYRQSRSNTDRKAFNQTSQMWEEATPADSHFDHSQQIYSAYLGYTMKFGKFGVKAGARAEGTSLKVRYELAPDMNFGNDYFDVVPSAVVSYQLSMSQQLRLGYNMRIQRPGIWYLNPYVSNADPQNISYGNPNLDSEKSNGVNLNYSIFAQKFSFNTSISYTFIDNSIERYTFIDPADPGIFRTTYGNIGKRQTTGLFVYGSWNPIPLFRVNLNGSLSYTDLRSEKNDMANSGFSGRVFAGAQFNLPLDIRLNLNGGFISSAIQLQGRRSPLNFATVYVSRNFLKKKLSVSLYFYDMFWKRRKMEATIYDDTFHRQDISYSPTRTFGIGISYRFGNLKDAIKKVKRGIKNDDVKALESGS